MSKEAISKIYLIVEKIEYIEEIVENTGNITNALNDVVTTRPAILMHLTAIAEQFNKLKHANETELLNHFDKDDLKGMYDTRTYIAHDYEGVNLAIIEWIVRHGLPKFKSQCLELIEKGA
ncbi:MAG: HepT-like ribonuclease domain-containing protein [Flavobacteriales bacterium]